MTLYKNKYRIESTRLEYWDYSWEGEYFVTICVDGMKKCFGEVKNGIMGLNELGNMAAICWQNIPLHFPFVELGAWVVMPNHVHGVIIINKQHVVGERDDDDGYLSNGVGGSTTKPFHVETCHGTSLRGLENVCVKNKFRPPKSGSLSSIINQYKGAVKRWCNKNNYSDFKWQPRFYDHIIIDDNESEEIEFYIKNNPKKWWRDRNNPANLWM